MKKKAALFFCFLATYSFAAYVQAGWTGTFQNGDDSIQTNNTELNHIERSSESASIYYDAIYLNNSRNYNSYFASKYGEFKELDTIIRSYYFGGNIESRHSNNVSAVLSSLGNTDVTYFATGVSRFLADRAKAELNDIFFSQMKENLNKYPELAIIFPLTTQVLNTIETYGYASIIQILRDAFENDLRVLPQNIYKLKDAEYLCYLISDIVI